MHVKKGFTLIELLVVIAIIALLLSIIMPSLKIAKERAMEILCENNIRQFGIGMNLYCSDNDNEFADAEDWFLMDLVRCGTTPTDFDCLWHDASIIPDGLIVSYLSDDDVRLCPAFRKIALKNSNCAKGVSSHNPAIPIEPQFNYTQNPFLGYLGCIKASPFVRKITQIKSPSEIFAYGEENPYAIPGSQRPLYGNFTVSVSSSSPVNDCLLYMLNPATTESEIQSRGGGNKYNVPPAFIDCLGSFHRAKDPEGYLGYSKAVFVDGHIQNVLPEESLIYGWPF